MNPGNSGSGDAVRNQIPASPTLVARRTVDRDRGAVEQASPPPRPAPPCRGRAVRPRSRAAMTSRTSTVSTRDRMAFGAASPVGIDATEGPARLDRHHATRHDEVARGDELASRSVNRWRVSDVTTTHVRRGTTLT